MPRNLPLGHIGVVLQRHRAYAVIASHQARECHDCADVAASSPQRVDLASDVEIIALYADRVHPPVTGGKKAISSSRRTGVSQPTCSWVTAARRRLRSQKTSAKAPPRTRRYSASSPTVSTLAGNFTHSSPVPSFCRTLAKQTIAPRLLQRDR